MQIALFEKITIFTMAIFVSASASADCYYNLSRYWAVTNNFPFDDSIEHEAYIKLENQNGRPVDGILMDNNLYLFNDEHPTDRVQKTDDICRMFVPNQPGQQAFFYQTFASPEPKYFETLIYVRFECGYSKTCAIDE